MSIMLAGLIQDWSAGGNPNSFDEDRLIIEIEVSASYTVVHFAARNRNNIEDRRIGSAALSKDGTTLSRLMIEKDAPFQAASKLSSIFEK